MQSIPLLDDLQPEIRRKNRITKSNLVAYEDDFLGWVTVCTTHNGYAEHRNKTTALDWLSSPWTWCATCGEIKR